MAGEKTFEQVSDIADVRTLSSQGKMRYLLEIFDLAQDGKSEERKRDFLDLLGNYKRASVEARVKSQNEIHSSDTHQAKIHNQIMEIIRKMSLSQGLTPNQRKVVEYLATDRNEVSSMIDSYFSGYETGSSGTHSQVQQARLGIGPFRSKPGEE